MNRLFACIIIALLVAASVGVVSADTTYIPAVRGGMAGLATVTPTPTNTPTFEATGTSTNTPTATSTATTTSTPTRTSTPTDQGGPCPCGGDTLNCTDFSTQAQAQACMDWCVMQGVGDIHNLDGNADGEACESLPLNFTVIR